MEEYKEEEDDDRRSIRSLASARLPSFSGSVLLDKSLAPDLENHARSPFAASQLFAAQADEGLDSIEEGSVPRRWRGEVFEFPDRPDTPLTDAEDHIWATRPNTAAPFRRPMDEDAAKADMVDSSDHHDSNENDADNHNQDQSSPSPSGTGRPPSADGDGSQGDSDFRSPKPKRVGFPRTETMQSDMTVDGRIPLSRMSSGMPLIGLRTRLSSRASQGGLTTLVDSERPEGLWRTRSHSVA
jgi:1-phosphatidylinositol-3-phosphate 5-kinase